MSKYRGLGVVVIPRNNQYPAVFCRSLKIGLTKNVSTPVASVTFTVPIGKHALFSTRLPVVIGKLRTPDRRCC